MPKKILICSDIHLITLKNHYCNLELINLMPKPVEFASFYRLLREVRDGNEEKNNELEWILAEYEHSKNANSAYDELGQIFCHHGVMELYEYIGVNDIGYISNLEKPVWDYLKKRMKIDLPDYMIKSMINHANSHQLIDKISQKWDISTEEIDSNIEDLAKYVVDGIIQLVS